MASVSAGAAQADAALLLVDGSKGNFEAGFEATAGFGSLGGGQTREHAQLARSFGVDQMAVVVSKLDTCDFSQVLQPPLGMPRRLHPGLASCEKSPTLAQELPPHLLSRRMGVRRRFSKCMYGGFIPA